MSDSRGENSREDGERIQRETADGREKRRTERERDHKVSETPSEGGGRSSKEFENEIQRASKQYLFHQFDTGCKWPRVEKQV